MVNEHKSQTVLGATVNAKTLETGIPRLRRGQETRLWTLAR